jgi:hypothetical protein
VIDENEAWLWDQKISANTGQHTLLSRLFLFLNHSQLPTVFFVYLTN